MKKIAYLTGTRADFGLMLNTLKEIEKDQKLKLIIYATGMHLLKEFGFTLDEVKKNFPQTKILPATYKKDTPLSMADFCGQSLKQAAKFYSLDKPDLILILGDRGEQLSSAIAGAYLGIPLAHIHAGDLSGTVDNKVRYAISQLADFYFCSSKKSFNNLKKILPKEKTKNIFLVGAPGIEEIKKIKISDKKKQIVILIHPQENYKNSAKQMKTVLNASSKFKMPMMVIYPNADAGGRKIIKVIKTFTKKNDIIKSFPSLPRKTFLKLLGSSAVFVSNSSCGLIEASSLKIPVVNIGNREKNREKPLNVIDVNYKEKQIINALKKALFDKKFQETVKKAKNPYDFGKTSIKIVEIIKKLIKNGQI